jgi:hypothetical protein
MFSESPSQLLKLIESLTSSQSFANIGFMYRGCMVVLYPEQKWQPTSQSNPSRHVIGRQQSIVQAAEEVL